MGIGKRKTIVSRLKTYAGLIFSMARESYDPVEVGEALWTAAAQESALYGSQIISLSKQILAKLDSIQAKFAADLLQVNRNVERIRMGTSV